MSTAVDTTTSAPGSAARDHGIPFSEAVRVWARVAALSFSGPAGQIAVMHRILVEEKRWIGENRFLHALNYCMLCAGNQQSTSAASDCPGRIVAATKAMANCPPRMARSSIATLPDASPDLTAHAAMRNAGRR